jgi:hypothetical protein
MILPVAAVLAARVGACAIISLTRTRSPQASADLVPVEVERGFRDSEALTTEGQERLELIRELSAPACLRPASSYLPRHPLRRASSRNP